MIEDCCEDDAEKYNVIVLNECVEDGSIAVDDFDAGYSVDDEVEMLLRTALLP